MATYIDVKPELIDWAIERARVDLRSELPPIIQKALTWGKNGEKPTLKQLTDFAKKVMVPFGYLFLETPPKEPLPIADFRTFKDQKPQRPSPNLLDTIYEMQARQEWMRETVLTEEIGPIEWIGCVSEKDSVEQAALKIRKHLQLGADWESGCKKRFQQLRDSADNSGVLVFLGGRVGFGKRRLDHTEFRGFVLVDEYAPLVFINSNDTQTAQLFTLAHELVHLAMGQSGLFNLPELYGGAREDEKHCNAIAAELLVPSKEFTDQWCNADKEEPIRLLARRFGVSTTVVARRALDHRFLSKEQFFRFYHSEEEDRLRRQEALAAKREDGEKSTGPNIYTVLRRQMSPRFSHAVVEAARCGELLHRDAFDLTGLKGSTFREFARRIREGRDE